MTRGLPSRLVVWGGLPPDVLATVAAAARARDIPISVYDQIYGGDPERRDPSPLRSIAPSPSVVLADEKLFMPEMRPGDLWFGAIKIVDASADCPRRRGVEVYDADELPTLLRRIGGPVYRHGNDDLRDAGAHPTVDNLRALAGLPPTSDTIGPAPYEIEETETRVSIHLRYPGGDVNTLCPVSGPEAREGKMDSATNTQRKAIPTSTVGRGKAVALHTKPTADTWTDGTVTLCLGDSLERYSEWDRPTVIVSDGAYGILGFEGDTSDHLGMPNWYEPHVREWSKRATANTTLWFWNSEIGWAAVHPVLERHGWRYVNANVWNKGKAHIAGNVNTGKIRRFPVVTEMCVQYVFEARIDGLTLQRWLHREWKRTGLRLRQANEACGVKDAAVRKYLDQGHLWYYPPPETFAKMVSFANEHGKPEGRPYFSEDGKRPMTMDEWAMMRSKFHCPMGFTNVWERGALHGKERVTVQEAKSRAVHLNQKPLDLMRMIIEASSDAGDVVWEPFGGLFSASLAARQTRRRSFASEIDSTYYQLGLSRFTSQGSLF